MNANPLHQTPWLYRMPAHFGPTPGPRQNLENYTPNHNKSPTRQTAVVSYLTDANGLAALLPPGFEIWGDPVLNIEVTDFQGIEWLAGRGYSMAGIRVPARYTGGDQEYCGLFQLVLWENLTDPIITGREELGAPKLFADIPAAREFQGKKNYEISWQNHVFLRLGMWDLADAGPLEPFGVNGRKSDGIIYYKYIPRSVVTGSCDAEYATLTPADGNRFSVSEQRSGSGEARFISSSFEQLPTMYRIVNALADLPLIEVLSATWVSGVGGRDHADTFMISRGSLASG
jgi:hypothetical protein